jgi:hypothetical protein
MNCNDVSISALLYNPADRETIGGCGPLLVKRSETLEHTVFNTPTVFALGGKRPLWADPRSRSGHNGESTPVRKIERQSVAFLSNHYINGVDSVASERVNAVMNIRVLEPRSVCYRYIYG